MLGNAAGTVARSYGHFFPKTHVEAVEIDAELTEIGRRYFDLRNPNMHVFAEDARPWLERSPGPLDAIMVDAYRQPYVPFYLTTVEFFSLAAENLSRRGLVMINVGHPEGQQQLERVLGRTLSEVFPFVMRDPIAPTNTILVASFAPISGPRLLQARSRLPVGLRATASRVANRLGPRLPGGEVFTDDRAPVEWLVDESLLSYAGGD